LSSEAAAAFCPVALARFRIICVLLSSAITSTPLTASPIVFVSATEECGEHENFGLKEEHIQIRLSGMSLSFDNNLRDTRLAAAEGE
jgi:hypothetical protein